MGREGRHIEPHSRPFTCAMFFCPSPRPRHVKSFTYIIASCGRLGLLDPSLCGLGGYPSSNKLYFLELGLCGHRREDNRDQSWG